MAPTIVVERRVAGDRHGLRLGLRRRRRGLDRRAAAARRARGDLGALLRLGLAGDATAPAVRARLAALGARGRQEILRAARAEVRAPLVGAEAVTKAVAHPLGKSSAEAAAAVDLQRALLELFGVLAEPAVGPLPQVAADVVEAIGGRRVRAHLARARVRVATATIGWIFAPRKRALLVAAERRVLPLALGRQALLLVLAEVGGLLPIEAVDGVVVLVRLRGVAPGLVGVRRRARARVDARSVARDGDLVRVHAERGQRDAVARRLLVVHGVRAHPESARRHALHAVGASAGRRSRGGRARRARRRDRGGRRGRDDGARRAFGGRDRRGRRGRGRGRGSRVARTGREGEGCGDHAAHVRTSSSLSEIA